MRIAMTTLALAAALTAGTALPSTAAPARTTTPASIATTSDDAPQDAPVRYEITIVTTGLSDYELARDEALVARRAQQYGLTVLDWHTGQGIVVETTDHTVLAGLLADPHVTGMRKVS
ncbi:hypothetical protein [Arsenicicoccus dermatophilus]|uniref:hypothetical protein n=1 Tax=Arsenicicoccus dermatophilus TaxID=1076331 RepID=UPI001F4CA873|nr:hypothetical protein [Arsenicicoccus dermatophilus]MCH8612765.1 hypothetical protein [Arsenicicoccus dermatophilus]